MLANKYHKDEVRDGHETYVDDRLVVHGRKNYNDISQDFDNFLIHILVEFS